MLKKLVSIALVGVLLSVASSFPVLADSKSDKEARAIERVRDGILELGTGEDARVEVKLHDRRKLKGYISESGTESFVLVGAKDATATTIPYSQVKQVKGHNLSTGARIAIGVAVAIAVPLILTLLVKVLMKER